MVALRSFVSNTSESIEMRIAGCWDCVSSVMGEQ